MRDIEQPVIPIDEELSARPWSPSDVPKLMKAFTDPDILYRNLRRLDTRDEALDLMRERRERWQAETGASWAVVDKSDALRAYFGLHDVTLFDGVAEVGYWVLPESRGQGVASRSIDALARWALDDFGLHRLELKHGITNEASCRVAVSAGFRFEGVLRSALLHADGWHDMHLHGRIAGDR